MKNMESSVLFNCAIRVKKEPCDVPLIGNDSETIDEKPNLNKFQFLPFPQENLTCSLQKFKLNHESELSEEVEIVVECADVKLETNLLAVKKIEDYSEYQLQNIEDNNIEKEMNFNLDSEPSEQNKKIKELNNKLRLKTAHSGVTHTCEICGKKLSNKSNLKKHINAIHIKIKHSCSVCDKKFSQKDSLKTHIDEVHNGIKYTCDECRKSFSHKGNLKIHIDAVHNKITYSCDECGKVFKRRGYLRAHVDSVHKKTTYPCDICRKKFSTTSNLRKHINAVHTKTKHACSICEKKFSQKDSLKTHIDKGHNFNKNNRYA